MSFFTNKPQLDAPLVSWTPKLISKGIGGFPYNVVRYGDKFWGVSWVETNFDVDRFLSGGAETLVLVGETVEEISYGLGLIFPSTPTNNPLLWRLKKLKNKLWGNPKEKFIEENANFFLKVASNVYRFKDSSRLQLVKAISHSPGMKNKRLHTNNLFEMGDGKPVVIVSPAPARTCNYRCEYCFHHDHGFTKNQSAMESWSKVILTAVERIPRPLIFAMGAMGEPLFMPKWREVALKILSYPHVQRIGFVSNLTIDPKDLISRVDPNRIGVLASLHPSEFKEHDSDLARFLERTTYLKECGVSVAVNYVLTPEQIHDFSKYKTILNARGIPLISNILRGPFRDKVYPEAYSEEEIKKARQCQSEIPFIYEYQSHEKNPYGIRCVSGRWAFHLEFDGTVYNCDFARQKLGSIYDEKLMVRTENCYCTATECESQVMISFIEDVVRDYRVQGNMHHFDKRPGNQIGEHPYL